MGYCISMSGCDMYIAAADKKEALKALKKAFQNYAERQAMIILEDAMSDL